MISQLTEAVSVDQIAALVKTANISKLGIPPRLLYITNVVTYKRPWVTVIYYGKGVSLGHFLLYMVQSAALGTFL